MAWKDEERERQERSVRAVEALGGEIRHAAAHLAATMALRPPEERGYVTELGRFPALAIALRLCVDAEARDALVSRFRRVPESYVDRQARTVRCVCGEVHPFGDLWECAGGCGRWFAADGSGAWAARLEEPAAEAAA